MKLMPTFLTKGQEARRWSNPRARTEPLFEDATDGRRLVTTAYAIPGQAIRASTTGARGSIASRSREDVR